MIIYFAFDRRRKCPGLNRKYTSRKSPPMVHRRADTMKVFWAVAVCSMTRAMDMERDLNNYTYEDYVKEFAKTSSEERRASFESNLELIKGHNSQIGKSWWATVNNFTDWTNEEFRAQRTGLVPPPHELAEPSQAPCAMPAADLPQSVDWRRQDVVSPVKDQGGW